jgi:ligand-binding SRPBCC domain-containing protein
VPLLRLVTHVHAPRERVFDLARSVELHVESLARHGERAVAGRTSGLLELGDEVTWRARHFGIPLRLASRIMELERPAFFVDEQARGPFASLRHEHRFEEHDGGILMTDLFEYRAPLGALGRIADRLFLERHLRRVVMDRAEAVKSAAETA